MHKNQKSNGNKIAVNTGTNTWNIFNNQNHQPYQKTHSTEYIFIKTFPIERFKTKHWKYSNWPI